MKIFFSIKDLNEAREIEAGGLPDIVDIKNPEEGTLGANKPWVIREVAEYLRGKAELGASIGDLDFKPGTASLAAYGVSGLGLDYVVASMYGVKTPSQAGEISRKLKKALEEANTGAKLIISGYADYFRVGSVNPFTFPEAVEGDIIMLDTAIKDGKNIFDFADTEKLAEFCDTSREQGFECCIAGSIRVRHLELAREVKPDILGFRGAICKQGEAKRERVRELMKALGRL